MDQQDINQTIERYNKRIEQFGMTEAALGWSRGNNIYRMAALVKEWKGELENSSIIDFGCGMGDLYSFLVAAEIRNFRYTGIDINQNLIDECKKRYPEAVFITGDISVLKKESNRDFLFCSGVFNHKLNKNNEYEVIRDSLRDFYESVNKGVAVNFLSDKVEYHTGHNFNSNPGKILEFCYGLTNHVVLRNDYMPFEFSVFLRKDIETDREKLIYK